MSPVLLLSLFFFSLELGLGSSRDEERCSGTPYRLLFQCEHSRSFKFYYDEDKGSCRPFTLKKCRYGSVPSSGNILNQFDSILDCERTCLVAPTKTSLTSIDSSPTSTYHTRIDEVFGTTAVISEEEVIMTSFSISERIINKGSYLSSISTLYLEPSQFTTFSSPLLSSGTILSSFSLSSSLPFAFLSSSLQSSLLFTSTSTSLPSTSTSLLFTSTSTSLPSTSTSLLFTSTSSSPPSTPSSLLSPSSFLPYSTLPLPSSTLSSFTISSSSPSGFIILMYRSYSSSSQTTHDVDIFFNGSVILGAVIVLLPLIGLSILCLLYSNYRRKMKSAATQNAMATAEVAQ